jgi:hypothetical protein
VNEKMPIAPVIAWHPPYPWSACPTVEVVCPYCGHIHTHGEGDGSRAPHCNTVDHAKNDYMLLGTDNARLVYELKREKFFDKAGHAKSGKPTTQAPKRTASYGERGRIVIDPPSASREEARS